MCSVTPTPGGGQIRTSIGAVMATRLAQTVMHSRTVGTDACVDMPAARRQLTSALTPCGNLPASAVQQRHTAVLWRDFLECGPLPVLCDCSQRVPFPECDPLPVLCDCSQRVPFPECDPFPVLCGCSQRVPFPESWPSTERCQLWRRASFTAASQRRTAMRGALGGARLMSSKHAHAHAP
jgi:hypothetical protein